MRRRRRDAQHREHEWPANNTHTCRRRRRRHMRVWYICAICLGSAAAEAALRCAAAGDRHPPTRKSPAECVGLSNLVRYLFYSRYKSILDNTYYIVKLIPSFYHMFASIGGSRQNGRSRQNGLQKCGSRQNRKPGYPAKWR